MNKPLLFPISSFVALLVVVMLSPSQAAADDCNDKVCTNTGGGNFCMAALAPPHTKCNDGPGWCLWDWCRIT